MSRRQTGKIISKVIGLRQWAIKTRELIRKQDTEAMRLNKGKEDEKRVASGGLMGSSEDADLQISNHVIST